jgi:hypothetical protein
MRPTIDTNCLNAYGRASSAVEMLERMAEEGRISLEGTERLLHEANYGERAKAKARAMVNVGEPFILDVSFFDSGAYLAESSEPSFAEIASICFPGRDSQALKQNEINDVMHLLAHHDGGRDIFVTANTKDFINGSRRDLLRSRWQIVVMTPEEAVLHLKSQAADRG